MQIVREEFGKGNDFCQKITYRTGTARIVNKKMTEDGTEVEEVTCKSTGVKPEDLLSSFRNSYNPRIAVTVDMIATGTDVKPLEIVFFMRTVKSRGLLRADERPGHPRDHTRRPAGGYARRQGEDALRHRRCGRSFGRRDVRHAAAGAQAGGFVRKVARSSVIRQPRTGCAQFSGFPSGSARSRTDRRRPQAVNEAAGQPLAQITSRIVEALDPDVQLEAAKKATGADEPSPEQLKQAATKLIQEAAQPIATNPNLRNR